MIQMLREATDLIEKGLDLLIEKIRTRSDSKEGGNNYVNAKKSKTS